MIYIFAETEKKAEIYKRFGKYRGAKTFGNRSVYAGGIHFTSADEIYILPRVSKAILLALLGDVKKAEERPAVHRVGMMEYEQL